MVAILSTFKDFLVRYQFPIAVIGLFIMAVGWLFQNADALPFGEKVLFPRYSRALKGYGKLKSHHVLIPGDTGFKEISKIMEEKAVEPETIRIKQIRLESENPGTSFETDGAVSGLLTKLTVIAEEGTGEMTITNLGEKLRQSYREPILWKISAIMFWVGFAIEVVLVIIAKK